MSLLREYIEALVSEELLGEKLLGNNFDIRAFKQLDDGYMQLRRYAEDHGLKKLGCGSVRCAYALSSGKVLKIASDVEQNQKEVSAFEAFGRDYVPQVFDHHPDYQWIIVEPVRTWDRSAKMQAETGIHPSQLSALERFVSVFEQNYMPMGPEYIAQYNKWIQRYPDDYDYPIPENLTNVGWELLAKFRFLTSKGIIDIAREDHWGVAADRRIVCVDTGIAY